MKIQCTILRDGGSKVDLDGTQYHFEPLEDGSQVADVENEKHADRFLAISEGYKVYRGELSPVGTPTSLSLPVVNDKGDSRRQQDKVARALFGSAVHENSYEIGGKVYELSDIVEQSFNASGLTAEEWNALEDDERSAKIDITLDDIAEAAEKSQPENKPADESDERAQLIAKYTEKFGKAPHYRLSVEKIKAELAE
jgi:hypothetical protein